MMLLPAYRLGEGAQAWPAAQRARKPRQLPKNWPSSHAPTPAGGGCCDAWASVALAYSPLTSRNEHRAIEAGLQRRDVSRLAYLANFHAPTAGRGSPRFSRSVTPL
jgi:hypothetical protein